MDGHMKLGHFGKTNMKKPLNLSEGMKLISKSLDDLDTVCVTCLKARQTRLLFGNERRRAERLLEIIHTDVCGPIDPPTWDGQKYIITFLDDYAHFTVVYLIERRSKVQQIAKEYANQAESKWNLKIAKKLCDNGREYVNFELKEWCKQCGIVLDCTTPYTPQLNGKADHLNRSLIEKTRASLKDANAHKDL